MNAPPSRTEAREVFAALLADHVEAPPPAAELGDDVALGEDGLGLDSIATVEILLACEDRWGIGAQALIERGVWTVADVLDHFAPA